MSAPMLFVEFKKTEPMPLASTWLPEMTAYIESVYQEDASKYKSAIESLFKLRSDIAGVGKDTAGREIFYRYYGQLELLDLRFVVDEEHCALSFGWYDSFKPLAPCTTQSSLPFEKAGVIFNLAALMSHVAASSNRSEEVGMKQAFNYFQCAAGVFQFIGDNFLHAPSVDLSKDCIQILAKIMLAQAQECMLEKVIGEKKKNAMIFKLASQASFMYTGALESMNAESGDLKGYFPKLWSLAAKAKYLSSLAHYHKALVCEEGSLFGEQVAYLTMAESLAKEAAKFSKDLTTCKPQTHLLGASSGSSKADVSATASLNELVQSHLSLMYEKLKAAIKDNDVVYHASVPTAASLGALEKMNTTKAMKLLDLHPNLPSVIGPDPFKELISIQVHEKASMYSGEKDELIRSETSRVAESDDDADARMHSLGLPMILDKLKMTLKILNNGTQVTDVPNEVSEWAQYIAIEEQSDSVSSLFQTLEGMKSSVGEVMNSCSKLLNDEQTANDGMRVKHGQQWTQSASDVHTGQLRADIKRHREDLSKGDRGDSVLKDKLSKYSQDFGFLAAAGTGNTALLEQAYKETLSGSYQSQAAVGNLLDMPTEHGSRDDQELVNTVDGIIRAIQQNKKDRRAVLADLKKKVQEDDINNLLVLNKKNESNVLQVEISKFNPLREKIIEFGNLQTKYLDDLATVATKLSQSDVAKETDIILQARLGLTNKYKDVRGAYEEVRANLNHGINFYSELNDLVDQLCSKCRKFSDDRARERETLITSLSSNYQNVLQQKLAQLSTGPTTNLSQSAPSAPYAQPQYQPQSQYQPHYSNQQPVQYGTYQGAQAPNQPQHQSSGYPYQSTQQSQSYSLPPHMQAPLQSVGSAPSGYPSQPFSQPQYAPPQNAGYYNAQPGYGQTPPPQNYQQGQHAPYGYQQAPANTNQQAPYAPYPQQHQGGPRPPGSNLLD